MNQRCTLREGRGSMFSKPILPGLLSLVFALVMQGCVPLIYHCNQGKFEGIQHQLARTNVPAMHFLLVHGMQTHQPGYASNLINNLTKKLNAQLVSSTPAEDLVSTFHDTNQIRELSYQFGS